MQRIAIIGAGAAGLVTAREALRAGLGPVLFEQSSEVGGVWRYDPRVEPDPLGSRDDARLHASLYHSLRTNLPRTLMAFRDFAFDDPEQTTQSQREFPRHDAVLSYLRRFAAHFDLLRHVRFGTSVIRVTPPEPQKPWSVESTDQAGTRSESFSAVAVCSGHYSVPLVPELAGLANFRGRVLHSHNYRSPSQLSCKGSRILLVGAGPSGVDLALELAACGARVFLAADDHTTSFAGVKHVSQTKGVARILADGAVLLTDGSRLAALDILLLCTGYRYSFPFLPAGVVSTRDGSVSPLYRELLWLHDPHLVFIGLPFQVVPFPQFEVQAKYWVALLTGRIRCPDLDERRSWLARHQFQLTQAGVARHHQLKQGQRQFEYHSELSALCGAGPLPRWFAALNEATSQTRKRDPQGYRDDEKLLAMIETYATLGP